VSDENPNRTEKPTLLQLAASVVKVCTMNGAEDVLVVACGAWQGKTETFDTGSMMGGSPEKIAVTLYNLIRDTFPKPLLHRLAHALLSGEPLEMPAKEQAGAQRPTSTKSDKKVTVH
jgi:hypothetical protein